MSDPVPDVSVPTVKNADDEPTWEVVVFQVEERICHSFRHVFMNASPVFNDRFLVPQSDLGRGSSKEKPIVLDDCNEKDFASLMRVLRPTRKHVSSGDFGLSEEEWLSVLRLSTTWEMKQIQKLSLTKLFPNEEDISPPDLILRAREYRIRSWFVKAMTRILTGFHRTPTETLISTLGLPTACKIVDLQLDTTLAGAFGAHPTLGTPRKFVEAPVTVEKLMLGYTESMIKDHIMGAFKEEIEGLYDL